MRCSQFRRFARLALIAVWAFVAIPRCVEAQQAFPDAVAARVREKPTEDGPSVALAFEKSYRDNKHHGKPVPLDACSNIRPLTEEFWTKKQVLADFAQGRTDEQLGAIVIVKTEFCCDDSRLCAVTTACLEKKATPLVARFRVYAAWIKNSPDHAGGKRQKWDQSVIDEYGFQQGPGARIVVMIPTADGKTLEWFSSASDLRLSSEDFDRREGRTPELEQFLAKAVKTSTNQPLDQVASDRADSIQPESAVPPRNTIDERPRSRFGFRAGRR